MSVILEKEIFKKVALDVAEKMVAVSKTAPKGRGIDNIEAIIVTNDTITKLSDKMKEIGNTFDVPSFLRDADNILLAPVIVIIGTKIKPLGLKKCGLCGFVNCSEKEKFINTPCAFNTGDLGIAIGSAVSLASMFHIDNRIMYTVGIAAIQLQLFNPEIKIAYGIPLSVSAKNPFFDRK